jgi:hypothetical protein
VPKPDKRQYSRILLVEGADDLFAITHLMSAHVPWPNEPEKWPVFVEVAGGVNKDIVNAGLRAEIKAAHVDTLGVVLDADEDSRARYRSVREQCVSLFPEMPVGLPSEGLVVENEDRRFGVWLMPDNRLEGGLESFLKHLVPAGKERLWSLAVESVDRARALGSDCKDAHLSKAELYTWMAWQDPPGQNPGVALSRNVLNPHLPSAAPFVAWFKNLYRL